MINRIEPTVRTYCQFWFENEKEPAFVKTLEYKYIWYRKWGNYKQGIYQPYLIACQIPAKFRGKVSFCNCFHCIPLSEIGPNTQKDTVHYMCTIHTFPNQISNICCYWRCCILYFKGGSKNFLGHINTTYVMCKRCLGLGRLHRKLRYVMEEI